MKHLKLTALLCLIAFIVAVPVVATTGFTDTQNHWAKETVNWGIEKGIAKGFPDGTFQPDGTVNESQFLAMLIRTFTDTEDGVPPTDWFKPYYDYSGEMNYPVTSDPAAVIKRTQVAEIVTATQGVNLQGDQAIAYLLVKGLAKGKVEGAATVPNFGGQDNLTRAEALQFIYNVVQKGVSEIKERPFEPTNPKDVLTPEELEEYENKLNPNAGFKREVIPLNPFGNPANESDARRYHQMLFDSIENDRTTGHFSFIIPPAPEGLDWFISFGYNKIDSPQGATVLINSRDKIIEGQRYIFNIPPEDSQGYATISVGIKKIGTSHSIWGDVYCINTDKIIFSK